MILSGQSIRKRGILSPFHERTRAQGMTFGVGPAGYDVRVAEHVVLRPGEFALASTVEHFAMPDDVLGVVHDKSTLARMGLAIQNTVIEPGWHGHLTVELSNHNPWPRDSSYLGRDHDPLVLNLQPGAPIAQIIFHLLDEPTDLPYSGKYQNQPAGAQPPLMEPGG